MNTKLQMTIADNWRLVTLPSLESTNSYLKEGCLDFSDGVVLRATEQFAGRGRGARVWQSTAEKDLMCSVMLSLEDLSVEKWSLLTLLAGVSLSEALTDLGCENSIKWPNDIVCQRSKLAGILTEVVKNEGVSYAVIGLGLNVNSQAQKYDIGGFKAISMKEACKQDFDIEVVLEHFLKRLGSDLSEIRQNSENKTIKILEILRTRLYGMGKEVSFVGYQEKLSRGTIVGVDSLGQLILNVAGENQFLNSGEISWAELEGVE
jgi:BirA family transcriptional regulator, biotin operon repressor / biotin---[acetyl-CoA-carboxylase] ligase